MRRLALALAAAAAVVIAEPAQATVTTTSFSLDDPIFHSASGTLSLEFDGSAYTLTALDLTVGSLHFDQSNSGAYWVGGLDVLIGGNLCGVNVMSENIGCFGDDFILIFDPTAILEQGQIEYQTAGVETHGFANVNIAQVTPTGLPEPATWVVMLLGLGAIGTAMRRRRPAAQPV